VYEILQPSDEAKLDTLNDFNQAMKSHQNGDYANAVKLFQAVLNVNPLDTAAKRHFDLASKGEWIDLTGGR
jgi:TolA-binding protein